ncbi:MAG: N-acetylmuramoyl-L-alanine amidase [Actinomycetes bacterium]
MAVYGGATQKLIPPGSNDPRIKPRVAILHVDAGNNESLYTYFRDRSGGIESHFHVRRDGLVEQYRDTAYQADANYKANDFAVSIETQGYGEGTWSAAQLAAIKGLLRWLNEVHDIPLQKVDTWDGSGVGYHVQFGAPGPWTPVAKTCPGPQRIKQFESLLVPWMREASRATPPKTTRGPEVDAALANLRKAKGKGQRAAALRAARRSLRSIRKWVAR